jgi:Gas vesicle synthesis protein GvpL/GvpF
MGSDAMENGETALYLFCFARGDALRGLLATAVDGHRPVLTVPHAPDLCAVISEVAREDFCGSAAEAHLQQLAWVAPRAVRHEAVLEEVMAHSPVLPLPFGTLFSSAEALSKFVDQHRETIAGFLQRVADHAEWSVKGWLDRKQALQGLTSTRLTAEQNRLSALPPGTRHFAEQHICRDIEKGLGLWLDEARQAVAGDLTRYASDFRECALSPRAHSESGAEEVLSWAFLLPASAVSSFQERVQRANLDHRPQGLSLQLSGPWPPFRFVPALSSAVAP